MSGSKKTSCDGLVITKYKKINRYRETTFGCGGQILLSADQADFDFSSPNYPNVPPPHAECVWVITAPPGKRVQIDFLERFDVKPSRG